MLKQQLLLNAYRGQMIPELSEIDKKILKGLQEDGRIAFTKLANKLNIPDTTLHFRVRKMKEKGIIKKFTIILGKEMDSISILIKLKVGGHIIPEASREKTLNLGYNLGKKFKFSFVGITEDRVTIYGLILLKNEEEVNQLIHELKRDPDIIDIEYHILQILKGEDFLSLELI